MEDVFSDRFHLDGGVGCACILEMVHKFFVNNKSIEKNGENGYIPGVAP